jgi:hypothetical protein
MIQNNIKQKLSGGVVITYKFCILKKSLCCSKALSGLFRNVVMIVFKVFFTWKCIKIIYIFFIFKKLFLISAY